MACDIIAIGNIIRETVVYRKEILGPVLGSPVAYLSILLGRLGFHVGVISYIGDDIEKKLYSQFRTVDCSGRLSTPNNSENHLIYDQNEAISVEYTTSAPYITLDSISRDLLTARKYFIGPMNYEVEPDILKYLHDSGAMVFTDLGGYGGTTCNNHFSGETRRGKYLLDIICRCSDVVKASEEDLKFLYPGRTVEYAVTQLLRDNVECVVITLGKHGVGYCIRGGEYSRMDALNPECEPENINTVGGGDAVSAGLLACYEGPDTIEESINYGQVLASLILEKKGGCEEKRFPTSVDVSKRIGKVMSNG